MQGGVSTTCAQQENGSDCGVFTAMVMHSVAVGGDVRGYLARDAADMRVRMFTDAEELKDGGRLDSSLIPAGGDDEEGNDEADSGDDEENAAPGASTSSGASGRSGARRYRAAADNDWTEDGAHEEEEEDTEFPYLDPQQEMVVDLHDQD